MATFSAKIYKHHKKDDGTYNVKICVYHKGKRVFIDTIHYVVEKQITKSLKIKDQFIISALNIILDDYRKTASDLGERLSLFSADQLKQYLLNKEVKIDFLKFAQGHIKFLNENKQEKYAAGFNTVRNHLNDFNKSNPLPVDLIDLSFIKAFERYLRGPKAMSRIDQFGRTKESKGKPLGDASVHVYLRDFQGLFSAAIEKYNKPALGLILIKYNPFGEYKIVEAPETEKRNIEVDCVKQVRDCEANPGGRAELARNLAMLSFYLCGMNAVDLFKKEYIVKNGRIEYNRSKTKGKRKDNAFISIHIPPEATALLEFAAQLPRRYASIGNLNKALSAGMAQLSETTKIPKLEFYKLRHSFGNQARNTCRMPKDDVALALNHVDHGRKTTDIYIEKDWKILDEVQESVLNLYREKEDRQSVAQAMNVRFLFSEINLSKLNIAV